MPKGGRYIIALFKSNAICFIYVFSEINILKTPISILHVSRLLGRVFKMLPVQGPIEAEFRIEIESFEYDNIHRRLHVRVKYVIYCGRNDSRSRRRFNDERFAFYACTIYNMLYVIITVYYTLDVTQFRRDTRRVCLCFACL